MKKQLKWAGIAIPLALYILCLSLTLVTYGQYGQYNLDSDMSSDMVLADLLNEEGHILTRNFYYSNEINLVSPILFYQIALRLLPTWHAARTAAIGAMLVLMALALLYLLRGAGLSWGAGLLACAALTLPLTGYQAFTLVYGGFYTVWAALTFLELGLVLRMKRGSYVRAAVIAALSLLGGLSGVRMLMICAAPLALCALIQFFLEARRAESAKAILDLQCLPMTAGSLILAAMTYAGYVINGEVLAKMYFFEQFEETTLIRLQPDMLQDQIMALMEYFGYRADTVLLSMEGLYSVFALVLPILGLAAIILLLRMDLNARERLLALFMQVSLLLGILINVLTLYDPADSPYAYAVSYYIPAALLLVVSVFWFLDRFACRQKLLRYIPMVIGVLMFLIGFNTYRDQDMNKWEDERSLIAQMLLEEDCHEGYATYWYANVLTELTDGQIEAYMVEDWDTGRIGKWLQRADHLDREPEGRVFAIYSMEDFENGVPGCDQDLMIYSSDKVAVCVYDDVQEFRDRRGEY